MQVSGRTVIAGFLAVSTPTLKILLLAAEAKKAPAALSKGAFFPQRCVNRIARFS